MVCLMATVMQAQTDSIRIESLPEIVVNADGQIETAEKTVLLPSVGVEFENDAVRELRFHFVWKRKDSLSRVVEKLNTFETVNIAQEDKILVVR